MSTGARLEPDRDCGGLLPTVSVVIPAYNTVDTIERALDSVYAQTYNHIIEVIVVDDGSADNTAHIVREKFPNVNLIQQDNAGNGPARNTGVSASTGEYVAFLDADDEWLPEKTALQVAAFAQHPEFDLLLTTVAAPLSLRQGLDMFLAAIAACMTGSTRKTSVVKLTFRDFLQRTQPVGVRFCCSSWLIRRSVICLDAFEMGRRRAVDWEFLLRLTGQGYSVGTLLTPLYRYCVRPDSVSNSPAGQRDLCSIDLEIIRRYDPAGSGWQNELLTPEEFRRIHRNVYALRAWTLWGLGERELARRYLKCAVELGGKRGIASLHSGLMVRLPGTYRTLARLQMGFIGFAKLLYQIVIAHWRS